MTHACHQGQRLHTFLLLGKAFFVYCFSIAGNYFFFWRKPFIRNVFSIVQESVSSLWVSNVRRHFDTMSIVGSYNSHLCSQSDDRPFSRLLAVSKAATTSDSATHGLWFVSLPRNLVSRPGFRKTGGNLVHLQTLSRACS